MNDALAKVSDWIETRSCGKVMLHTLCFQWNHLVNHHDIELEDAKLTLCVEIDNATEYVF